MLIISTVVGMLLVGTLLALRFKTYILVATILIAACAIVATGAGPKAIALTILATGVALQIGYALGLVVRVLAAKGLRAPRNHLSKSKPA